MPRVRAIADIKDGSGAVVASRGTEGDVVEDPGSVVPWIVVRFDGDSQDRSVSKGDVQLIG